MTPSKLTENVTFSATVTCTVFAIPLPSITWIKVVDGTVVTDEGSDGRVFINQTDNGDTRTSVLHFNSTVKPDESNYTCVAVNNITNVISTPENDTVNLIIQGTYWHYCYIILITLIFFYAVPANITALTSSPAVGTEGQNIVLSFLITNDDPLVSIQNIRWEFSSFREPEDITNSNSVHYVLSSDRLSLTIIQLTTAQIGLYTLFATNEAGVRSNSIRLALQSKK